jgi:hypothetical protein
MTTIINEIIPKSQENSYIQIEGCIKNFFSSIAQDTSKLLEITNKIDTTSKDDTLIKTFIDNIDTHLTKMLSTIQQPIFNSIQSSEERTNTGIQQIKENFVLHQNIQETLRNEMQDFLNKYKSSSQFKGNVAEVELQHMLLSIMPSDEIIRVSNDTATCDFKVNRKDPNKPGILFESKNYKNHSSNTQEVKKFERDLQLQKMHGIFISQESPITFKDNFQIDIINGLIHVYIPNANYDVEKIKIAVDIIDNLSLRLIDISKDHNDEYSISKEDIDSLKMYGFTESDMSHTDPKKHIYITGVSPYRERGLWERVRVNSADYEKEFPKLFNRAVSVFFDRKKPVIANVSVTDQASKYVDYSAEFKFSDDQSVYIYFTVKNVNQKIDITLNKGES